MKENIGLPSVERLSKMGIMRIKQEAQAANKYFKALRIKTPSLKQKVMFLSCGNQQKVVLSKWLCYEADVFIFDEPTTGLHFHDIGNLLNAINSLVNQGNTVVIIEHNMEVIKCADWVIDLGHEGGDGGGEIVFAGTPEAMVTKDNSITAKFLKPKLKK